jgi:hypothetical protein
VTRTDFLSLPANLPPPIDDGACDHLQGLALPSISLSSTAGSIVDLHAATQTPTVLFFYPRTGRPDEAAPTTNWDAIPGAVDRQRALPALSAVGKPPHSLPPRVARAGTLLHPTIV